MFTLFKWIFVTLLTGLAWLLGKYANEYFHPQYIKVEK